MIQKASNIKGNKSDENEKKFHKFTKIKPFIYIIVPLSQV